MDRNSVIGLTLIFILFFIWQWMLSPTQEEMEARQRALDSLAQLEQEQTVDLAPENKVDSLNLVETQTAPDSATLAQNFGVFSKIVGGEEQLTTLKNDLFTVVLSNKGGVIKEVELHNYQKVFEDSEHVQTKKNLKLLEDSKNKFEYAFQTIDNRTIRTGDLTFDLVQATENSITYRAQVGPGKYLEQKYSISPETYRVDYDLAFVGLSDVIDQKQDQIQLSWINHLDRIELNTNYERNYSSGYFKVVDENPDYCSCQSSDTETIEEPIKWVSNVNQFFNSSLIADQQFSSGVVETVMLEKEDEDLKIVKSSLMVPYAHSADERFGMEFYIGPNEFDRLKAVGYNLDQVIPFGSSILGTINRWVIRPAFSLLLGLFSSEGLTILILTLLIKLTLYPLTYRMLYSQSKMGALKPHLESMRGKFKDDPQQMQMEQMKLYREFGVNPLGGCMPMVLQMPIWIALYRFFPASIEFRQAEFLWANDLSSYDAFLQLPFSIPFGFGSHLSLFTLLWAFTTLIYTYYNTRHMDMSANPAMKYMQYVMPLFFMGFFNSFASGLTCYLLFSNLINITQTLVTKNYIIDQDKIKKELDAYRKKPKKKKKGFQARMEQMLEEQKRLAAEREAEKNSGKTKDSSKPKVDLQAGFEKIIGKLDVQLQNAGDPEGLSQKSSKVVLSSINDLEKLIGGDDTSQAKKSVDRLTARRLRGLLTEVETIVKKQPENKYLAKVDLAKVKSLKSKL